ncbi:MAG: DUF6440 family protein [Oscillospiraceae bacterium]|nr:DUF6440 family protein [Oscillospiraceae bacterium]
MKTIVEKDKERFIQKLIGGDLQILIDTKTGVQYLSCMTIYKGWATALLDVDGKPLIDNSYKTEEKE